VRSQTKIARATRLRSNHEPRHTKWGAIDEAEFDPAPKLSSEIVHHSPSGTARQLGTARVDGLRAGALLSCAIPQQPAARQSIHGAPIAGREEPDRLLCARWRSACRVGWSELGLFAAFSGPTPGTLVPLLATLAFPGTDAQASRVVARGCS